MTLNFKNIFSKDNKIITLLLAFLVLAVVFNSNPVQSIKESFTEDKKELKQGDKTTEAKGPGPSVKPDGPVPVLSTIKAHDEEEQEYGLVGAPEKEINVPSCAQFVSSNLLPKDDPKLDANFTEFSPAKELQGQDFIDTNKYAIGMQSQTLRNANHQLRSDPPIVNTMSCSSPWNNTTINQEARRPLTIGSTA